jgi:hypothetical protein
VKSYREDEVRERIDAAVTAATAPIQAELDRLREDPAQQGEWIRQNNLAYAGLIAIALVLVQPLVTAGSLDLSAQVCVVAFAVSIPLLAALILVGRQEEFRRSATTSVTVNWFAKPVAQFGALVGVVAGFWHTYWVAGVAMLATAVVAVGVHSAGFSGVEWPGRGLLRWTRPRSS